MTYQKRAPHILLFFMILCLMSFYGTARSKNTKKETPVYSFTIDHEVKRTPVKNQYRTGTCWCFATISFLESELLRTGKGEVDLSEMFVVRHTYPHKALKYVRYHGNATFGQGGQSHDVFDAIKRYGIVTEQAYSGKNIGEKRHNHSEMKRILTAILDSVLKKRWGTQITPRWMEAFKAVLDVYLGKLPEKFTIKGKEYTPKDFLSEYTGLNFDNYVELTSYTHHPFYKTCCLEIPDNWTHNSNYYNIPIDELERIVDHALKNGYSVIWDGDVSERDFSYRKSKTSRSTGYAIVPLKDWEEKSFEEKKEKIKKPVKEKEITQEMRQKTFENMTTTDDHLMHIVGVAHNQTGTKFYLTKNSGGPDRTFGGYIYLSRAFFRLKTTAITVHKDSIPSDLKAVLGL